eukprot:1236674-Rhodomonas_salina.1
MQDLAIRRVYVGLREEEEGGERGREVRIEGGFECLLWTMEQAARAQERGDASALLGTERSVRCCQTIGAVVLMGSKVQYSPSVLAAYLLRAVLRWLLCSALPGTDTDYAARPESSICCLSATRWPVLTAVMMLGRGRTDPAVRRRIEARGSYTGRCDPSRPSGIRSR